MKRLHSFIRTSLLGGLIVILPVAILFFVFHWIFQFVTNLIAPLTNILLAKSDLKEIIANILVILIIVGFCFLVGAFVKTRFGRFIHNVIEERLFRIAPGYNMVKEIVLQLFGGKKAPFSSVALARIFQNETLVTAFVTDEHPDGSFTVFVPTGPNPTSGNIFHLKADCVTQLDISVEDAMRTIISCGNGSSQLLEAFQKAKKDQGWFGKN